ncbi:MAG: hypothetical protein QM645_06950 [Asticcacaulis sp.]
MLRWLTALILLLTLPPLQGHAETYPETIGFTFVENSESPSTGKEGIIYAFGAFDGNARSRFLTFIRIRNITHATVVFDSPGGNLFGGLELGEAIRDNKFNTAVGRQDDTNTTSNAICASACSYAFAGGIYRYLTRDNQLGLHQFSTQTNQGDLGQAQTITALIVDYLDRMGVQSQAYTTAAFTSHTDITWLTPAQALKMRFANNGRHITTAEIKLVNMLPYLRLEQVQHDMIMRTVFLCNDKREVTVTAGIGTTPELTLTRYEWTKRAYLTFDDQKTLLNEESPGVIPFESVLWIVRQLSREQVAALGATQNLGLWVEAESPDYRWGGTMELEPVKDKIAYFAEQCYAPSF